MKILLILIYSGLSINTEKYASMEECISHSNRIGEELKVTMWDNMNNSNPIPKVVITFCVNGNAS